MKRKIEMKEKKKIAFTDIYNKHTLTHDEMLKGVL